MNNNLYPVQKDPGVDDQNNNPSPDQGGEDTSMENTRNDESVEKSVVQPVTSDLSTESEDEEDEMKTSTEVINDLEDFTESFMDDTAF